MSVEQEAKAAAVSAYPMEVVIDGDNRTRLPRTAYAHGYQAGHAAAMRSMIEWLIQRGIRPEIDQAGCCELCRGTGAVAAVPWGVRPPKITCPDCDGSGWSRP